MSHRIEGSAYVAYSASRSKTGCNAGRHPGGGSSRDSMRYAV
jgi:hypothetical protein